MRANNTRQAATNNNNNRTNINKTLSNASTVVLTNNTVVAPANGLFPISLSDNVFQMMLEERIVQDLSRTDDTVISAFNLTDDIQILKLFVSDNRLGIEFIFQENKDATVYFEDLIVGNLDNNYNPAPYAKDWLSMNANVIPYLRDINSVARSVTGVKPQTQAEAMDKYSYFSTFYDLTSTDEVHKVAARLVTHTLSKFPHVTFTYTDDSAEQPDMHFQGISYP